MFLFVKDPAQLRYLIFGTLCIIAYYDCDYNCSALPFPFFLCEFFVGEIFSRNCENFDLGKMIILKDIIAYYILIFTKL